LDALVNGRYLCAGFIHLQSPDAFLPIMPNWAPAPREVILITGIYEIAGALGLVTRSFRWWAAVMLALYAVCVFPANIKHAFENVQLPQLPSSWWYHGPRFGPAAGHRIVGPLLRERH
jgi:uncharacterized membrane protein